MGNIDVGTAAITAVMGYAVVFFGLVLLMLVVIIEGRIMVASGRKKAATAAPAMPAETAKKELPAAAGTAGELKLHDVDPKTAAILMAIVADKTGRPLNELRFKSIREVK